ncbi:hypothetical protein GE09DRAFT_1127265 [Coniochaeta sp. 2T2.1]|nr:hypothetical protein GE09DRAFT_1127265 [Coniochaeta sp. 2T2.1]
MTTRTITTSGDSPTNFRNGLVRPLTTVFTQPSSGCASPIPETDVGGPSTYCAPPDFAQVWPFGFYSPGVCPSGYMIGCSYSNNMGAPWTITPGETAALCVRT